MKAWRDLDHSRRRFGVEVYVTGATLHVGTRTYRILWTSR
jgi:hypothetical protein